MEKRELFLWKESHEKLLVNEILQEEPYKFKMGSKERGSCWTNIAERLTQAGLKVNQRSVREKFNKMIKEFKKKEQEELKASGVEVEYGELDQGLNEICELMTEAEEERENQTKKQKKEQKCAEEMRKKATETLSQTKKRKSSGASTGSDQDPDPESEDDANLVTAKKKKRGNASISEIMIQSLEVKKKEKEQDQEMRARELEFRAVEQENQRSFQERMMLQQSSFMQQQQAMNMNMINAMNEMMKNFRN